MTENLGDPLGCHYRMEVQLDWDFIGGEQRERWKEEWQLQQLAKKTVVKLP